MEKPNESKWNMDDLRLGLRTVKKFGDQANPQHKAGLATLWEEYRPRVASEFEIMQELEAREATNQVQAVVGNTEDLTTGSLVVNEGANEDGRTVM